METASKEILLGSLVELLNDEEFKKDFLCEIPLDPEVGKQGDKGTPIVESNPENEVSKIYLELASKIKSIYLLN